MPATTRCHPVATALLVLGVGHDLEMTRVTTRLVLAEVIDRQPFGDRTNPLLIRNPMDAKAATAAIDAAAEERPSVALVVSRPAPHPAPNFVLGDPGEDAILS